MRKGMVALMLCAFVLLVAASALMAGDEPMDKPMEKKMGEAKWLDPEHCYYCQPLVEDPTLLQHVHWESYPIENGVLDVTTVDPGFEEMYEKAHKGISERWEKFNPADNHPMCGACKASVEAWDPSIKMQDIKTQHGHVMLTTCDKPEVVAKLHAISERTSKEMAALMKMGEEAHAH